MIIKKANGHGGKKVWYDRKQDRSDGTRWRHYHVFTIALAVCSKGSFWRVIVGPWAFAIGFRARMKVRK